MKKKLVVCALVLCVLATLLAVPAMAEDKCAHDWNYIGKAYDREDCENWGVEYDEFECTKCKEHKKDYVQDIEPWGHTWKGTVTTKPTCTKEGVMTYECQNDNPNGTYCNKSYTEVIPATGHNNLVVYGDELPPCKAGNMVWTCADCHDYSVTMWHDPTEDHKWDDGVVTKEPTCLKDGEKVYTCTVCKETKKEVIPALGHTLEKDPEHGIAASCTKEGYDAYTCKRCGETVWEKLGKLDHKWDNKADRVVKPVCGTDGAEYDICSVCGAEHVIKVLKSEGAHELQEVVLVEPTCEKKGKAQKVCKLCFRDIGEEYELPELGHTYTSKIVKPTCTEQGYTLFTCTRCGFETKADYTEKIPHPYEITEVVKPTCTEKGYTVLTCKVCGFSCKVDYKEPTGHTNIPNDAVPATCTTEGITRGDKCKVCGVITRGEKIPALGHKEETIPGKAATCTEAGVTDGKKCTVCGVVTVAQTEIAALGHKKVVDAAAVAATCDKAGSTEAWHCENCDVAVKAEAIPALGHKEETLAGKAATCTEKGITEGKKCSVCGTVTVAQKEIAALGHKAGAEVVTKAATCTEKGTATISCTVCKTVLETKELAALGHKAGELVVVKDSTCRKTGTGTISCTVCGVKLEDKEIARKEHRYDKQSTCLVCGYNPFGGSTKSSKTVEAPEAIVVNAEGKDAKYTSAAKDGVQTVTVTETVADGTYYILKISKDTLAEFKNAGASTVDFVVGKAVLSIPMAALESVDLSSGELQFSVPVSEGQFSAQLLKNDVSADQTDAMTAAGVVVK